MMILPKEIRTQTNITRQRKLFKESGKAADKTKKNADKEDVVKTQQTTTSHSIYTH